MLKIYLVNCCYNNHKFCFKLADISWEIIKLNRKIGDEMDHSVEIKTICWSLDPSHFSRENNKIPWDFPEFPEKIEFPEFSSFPWVFQVVDTMLYYSLRRFSKSIKNCEFL